MRTFFYPHCSSELILSFLTHQVWPRRWQRRWHASLNEARRPNLHVGFNFLTLLRAPPRAQHLNPLPRHRPLIMVVFLLRRLLRILRCARRSELWLRRGRSQGFFLSHMIRGIRDMLGMRSYIEVSIVVVNERKQEQTMKGTCRKCTRLYHGKYAILVA